MKFQLHGHLAYQVNGPATIISSMHCMRTEGQEIFDESFFTSRSVNYDEVEVALGQNRFSRITLEEPGELSLDYWATAVTSPVCVPRAELHQVGPAELSPDVIPFLFPSRYCQSDMLREEAARLFPNYGIVYDQVEAVADWVTQNVSYVVGSSDEQTSALDVMNQRCGVCRDFAHLAIAFCRALTIPARYATVYAYRLAPQDFHACFEVSIGGDWYLFDATSLVPLNGLVRISVGRDASDAAVASLFGDIQGTELSVSCDCLDDIFEPVTRESLQNTREAFKLG